MDSPRYRHEFKYIISEAQHVLLQSRIRVIMKPDPHAVEGEYRIRSLYFDDRENSCLYENLSGTDPREKFRIRIYNASSSRITLECKRKERGMTQKLSCPLTRQEADALINGIPLRPENHHPLLRKLILKQNTQLFHPIVIVEYDRIPYVYREGGVRVTFDRNLASSSCTGEFFRETVSKRPVMPAGMLLMEVKFNEFLTDPIYRALNTGTLQQTAFSKYYLCRKYDNRGI